MLLGVILAMSSRFLFHFISGIVFYGSYAEPGQTAAAYSFFYNLSYIGPEAVLCILVLAALPIKQLYSIVVKQKLSV
jgi:thiamine transporter